MNDDIPGYSTAQALLRQGRAIEALRYLDQLLALTPFSPAAPVHHCLRGTALQRLGRRQEAAAALETAVSLQPDFSDAWATLGIVYGELGQATEALRCFERLCKLLAHSAPAHNLRAAALVQLHRYEEAVAGFRQALRLDPKFVPALLGLGDPLSILGRNEEALAAYEGALKIDPKDARAELSRGDILQILGRIDEAAAAYERAISLAPHWAVAYRHLFQVKTVTGEDDPALKTLQGLQANDARLPESERAELHLALSKAYRDLGRYGPAFEHLKEGNRRKRRAIVYNEATVLAEVHATAQVLTPKVLQAKAGLGDPSELPVFVFGMPRSGTSLVEHILASHSQVFGVGECAEFFPLAAQHFGRRLERLGDGPAGEDLRRLGAAYVARMAAKAPQAARIVDKTLINFSFAGLIHLALPKARMIHVIRDPMDTCFSCYSQLFMGTAQWIYDLGEVGRYYKAYADAMACWRSSLPAQSLLEIRYEALVNNFEAETRHLLAFCGLDWEDGCLRFYQTKRAVRTASAVQVRHPIYQEAIGRWKPYAEWLAPLREALGD